MNERAPRPGITSFTRFHPSFHAHPGSTRHGGGTPAEFYKMRHMRYIIIQCELPRYSEPRFFARLLNGSYPVRHKESEIFYNTRTTRAALGPLAARSHTRCIRRPRGYSLPPFPFPFLSFFLSFFLPSSSSFFWFVASLRPLSFRFAFFGPREMPARTRAPQRPRFLTCRLEKDVRLHTSSSFDLCTPRFSFFSHASEGDFFIHYTMLGIFSFFFFFILVPVSLCTIVGRHKEEIVLSLVQLERCFWRFDYDYFAK